jgi:hypothetical protein
MARSAAQVKCREKFKATLPPSFRVLKDGELTAQAAHATDGAAGHAGRMGLDMDSDTDQGLGTGLEEVGTMSGECCAGHALRLGDADAADAMDATEASAVFAASEASLSGAPGPHSHLVDVHSGIWLERRIGEASTIKRHTYCRECGSVRASGNGGRQVSFFLQGIANIVRDTTGMHICKITQSEARLMSIAVRSSIELNDPYSTPFELQLKLFTRIVRSFRPLLDEDTIMRSLFRRAR